MVEGPLGGPRPFTSNSITMMYEGEPKEFTSEQAFRVEQKIREEQGARVDVSVSDNKAGNPTQLIINTDLENALLSALINTNQLIGEELGIETKSFRLKVKV